MAEKKADKNAVYAVSENVVVREIDGERIIVPLKSGIGNMDDDLYTLNKTGAAIWDKLDGRKTLNHVILELADGYKEETANEIEQDVLGFTTELVKRKMLVEVSAI